MSEDQLLQPIVGLHHVTAIASDPQRNLDFYTKILGLRLVKRTINFDDPGTYHLYFGDDLGSPGTILTFFPWPHAVRGKVGVGETAATAFSVPAGSLPFWETRLLTAGVAVDYQEDRFGDSVLRCSDPDGMRLELVAHAETFEGSSEIRTPRTSNVPAEQAIRGFFGVTLCEAGLELTSDVLQKMGFRRAAEAGMDEKPIVNFRERVNRVHIGGQKDRRLRFSNGNDAFGHQWTQ